MPITITPYSWHSASTLVYTRWSSKLYCILNLSKVKYNKKCGYLWMCVYFGLERSESARYLSQQWTNLASMTQYQMNLHLYTCVSFESRAHGYFFLLDDFFVVTALFVVVFFSMIVCFMCACLMISRSTQAYKCIWCKPLFWIDDDKQRKMNAKKKKDNRNRRCRRQIYFFHLKINVSLWNKFIGHRRIDTGTVHRPLYLFTLFFPLFFCAFVYRKIYKRFSLFSCVVSAARWCFARSPARVC